MIASCGFLEDELRQHSKKGVTMADSGNACSALENQSQEVGSERKSKKEEGQGEILAYQQEKSLPKELHGSLGQEIVEMVPARAWRGHAVEMVQQKDLNLGGSSKKETTSLSLFMEAFGLEVKSSLP